MKAGWIFESRQQNALRLALLNRDGVKAICFAPPVEYFSRNWQSSPFRCFPATTSGESRGRTYIVASAKKS